MEEKTKKRMMKVGLASICLAMATPLVFAGCSAEPVKGDKGDPGQDGKSAYEIANEQKVNNNEDPYANEQEWLDSLKGESGTDGKPGTDGKDGVSVIGVSSEMVSHNGVPTLKFTFTYSNDTTSEAYSAVDMPLEFDIVGSTIKGVDATLGKSIDAAVEYCKTNIFNKVDYSVVQGSSNTYTVDNLKSTLNLTSDIPWFVKVGSATDYYDISQIRIGNQTYNTNSTISLSIGNNCFINDKVFEVKENNDLYVAFPALYDLVAMDTTSADYALNGNFGIINSFGDREDIVANTVITPWADTDGTLSVTNAVMLETDGVVSNNTSSSTATLPVYNVALKNGTTTFNVECNGLKVGDKAMVRITEKIGDQLTETVRYAYDTITSENTLSGYVAGWLEGDAWDSFTKVTRTYDVFVTQTDGSVKSFSFKTVAEKMAFKAYNVGNDTVATVTDASLEQIYSKVYGKISNTSGATVEVSYDALSDKLPDAGLQNTYMVPIGSIPGITKDGQITKIAFANKDTSVTTTTYDIVKEFSKTDKVKLGVDQNVFITSNAFKIQYGYIYMPSHLVKSMAYVSDTIIIDGDAYPFVIYGDATPSLTLNLVNGTTEFDVPASQIESKDDNTYEVKLTDTTQKVMFTYGDASGGDNIFIIEYSVDSEGNKTFTKNSIDLYSTEYNLFFYDSYGAAISAVEQKTRHFVIITPKGVAELTLIINPQKTSSEIGS